MADDQVPGFTASPDLEAKLEGLDDNLLPKDKVSEDEPAQPAQDPKADDAQEDDSKEEESKEEDNNSKNSETDEEVSEGYAIDEETGPEQPTKPIDEKPVSNLSPEQQYIVDNISPITVRGTVGDGDVKEYKVYSPEQLPSGFKYTDDRESSAANKAFSMLENKAVELQTEFRSQETQKSAKAFKEAEDSADKTDIGRLQREGELPKFKVDPDSKDFEKDPAAMQIQEILDFKDKKNNQYLEEANAGRPYKHIGFEEAFLMFKRENPSNPAQDKEDTERENLAKRTTGTRGASSNESPKARVHSGMGTMDLDRLIEERTQGW